MPPDPQCRLDLYVRADAPAGKRSEAVVDQLRRLERQNSISDFSIHLWPRAVSLDLLKRVDGADIVDTVRSFEVWASQHDREITPTFDVHTTHSTLTGESDELLVLPVTSVATYAEDTLVDVAPCRRGGFARTVENALTDVAHGNVPTPDPSSGEPRSDARPEGTVSVESATVPAAGSVTRLLHRWRNDE
jgi:hypothetical protein